ncbi:MAG: hypothetical protein ABF335_13425 [Alphaproteobacteria bacterium]
MAYMVQSIVAFAGLVLTAVGLSSGSIAAYDAFFLASAILTLLVVREFMGRSDMKARAAIADIWGAIKSGGARRQVAAFVVLAVFSLGLMASGALMGLEPVTQTMSVAAH